MGQERHWDERIEISDSGELRAMTFSVDGKHVLSCSRDGVRVWRVADGKQMATMEAQAVCLAVSKDGRWIAAGTRSAKVHVWDAKTYTQVFVYHEDSTVTAVEFSPDSSHLVCALQHGAATVWEIATREKVHALRHEDWVFAAKYSSQGDRIATTTGHSVRVYDGDDGRLFVDIEITVTQWVSGTLVWSNNHLLVVSDGEIKQFEASTGLPVSGCPAPDIDPFSYIALSKHGEFIAYSAKRTVIFFDMATYTQLGLIQHPQDIWSIALSPDNLFIAIGGEDGKIIIEGLSRITVSSMCCWIRACMNNFTPKSRWHAMLGIYIRAKATRRTEFDFGKPRQRSA